MKNCTIPDCDSPLLAKGFCRKHYLRNYRHGDPHFVSDPVDYQLTGEDSANFKHGHWDHPLYKTWSNMMRRCYNPKEHAYKNYGARGIQVCGRWHNVAHFIEDMGDRPEGMTLDRKDNSLGYSKENCRWACDTTQSRNRRFAKLTLEKAQEMRRMREEGSSRQALADHFEVSLATVKKVLSGAYWKE